MILVYDPWYVEVEYHETRNGWIFVSALKNSVIGNVEMFFSSRVLE